MPRPKRTKLNSARNANPPQPAPVVARNSSNLGYIPHADISDDSDGLVFKSKRVLRRKRYPWMPEPEPQLDEDLTMTGGLPIESDAEPHGSVPRSRSPSKGASLSRGGASPRKNKSDAARTTPQSRPRPTSPQAQQVSATPAKSPNVCNIDDYTEDYSLTSINSKSSPPPIHPSSALRKHATPAIETTILSLANFKRRQRQPSILRMVHQATDVEDNDLDDTGDLTFGDLDVDDFNPDDESTPLQLHRKFEQEKDNSRLPGSSSCASSGSRKRKLKSPDMGPPRSSPPYNPPSGSDLERSRASSPLPEAVAESREYPTVAKDPVQAQLLDEINASPRSSSPGSSSDEGIDIRPARRSMKAQRDEEDADAEPDLVKKRPTRAKAKQKPNEFTLSTAKLQAMLPRRKTRLRTTDTPDSDEESEPAVDSDQDELQRPPSRRAPAAAKRAIAKTNNKKKKAPPKPKKAAPAVPSKGGPRGSRTYGRTSSDKENETTLVYDEEAEDDTGTTPVKQPRSAALTAIGKMFEKVDKWELEFETVPAGDRESSSWR